MRFDRFLGDVQMVLRKPRYLIEYNVAEWSTPIQKLCRRGEGLW